MRNDATAIAEDRGLFAMVRERLANRPDTEHQAALIRIVIAVIAGSYLAAAVRINELGSTEAWHVMVLIFTIIPYSIGVLISIIINPHASVPRRILSIFMDVGGTTYVLYFLGAVGTPVYGVYLFNACGNGFRFGPRYLLLSSVLSVSGFSFILVASDFWASHRALGVGLLLVLIVIPVYFAGLVRQLHIALERMRSMANHDALTGLPNRHSFYEQLEHTLKLAKRTNVPFSVVFIDLDGFKEINDVLGHAVGDQLIVRTARRLEKCIRKADMVARMGGDEFVVLLRDRESFDIPRVAENIIQNLAKPFMVGDKSVSITTSIGVAMYPQHGEDVSTLIHNADSAMYEAKRNGKNGYRMCRNNSMPYVPEDIRSVES